MHDIRGRVACQHLVQVRQRSGYWYNDTLTAALTPHEDTSTLADSGAYVIVVQRGDIGHSAHLGHAQLSTIMQMCLPLFLHDNEAGMISLPGLDYMRWFCCQCPVVRNYCRPRRIRLLRR